MSRDNDYASKGVGGTALGIGIGALALSVLQGGGDGQLLGGLFGGNSRTQERLAQGQRAETELAIINSYFMPTWQEVSDLKSRVAVNEARDDGNQKNTALLFELLKQRADSEFALSAARTDAKINAATCNVVRGTPMVLPSQLGEPYQAGSNFLLSRHVNGSGGFCGAYSGGCYGC